MADCIDIYIYGGPLSNELHEHIYTKTIHSSAIDHHRLTRERIIPVIKCGTYNLKGQLQAWI